MKFFLKPAPMTALLAVPFAALFTAFFVWPTSAQADAHEAAAPIAASSSQTENQAEKQAENQAAHEATSHAVQTDEEDDALGDDRSVSLSLEEDASTSRDRDPFALDLDAPKKRVLQWSGRIGAGFGARRVEGQERKFLGELHLRADFLWGLPGDRSVRYGPAIEVRSANFSTIEGAAGGMLLIPTHPGWPLQFTAMFGYAGRFRSFGEHSPHAPIFVGTAAFGYRSYNFHSRYGYAINVFASTRTDLIGRGLEVTGGIELDLAFPTVIPARMIKMSRNKRDPDEPEDEEGDYYED